MHLLSQVLHFFGASCVSLISFLGYPGVLILMVMESMIFPVPSEAVMPFAGFLAGQGKLNLIIVIISSSFGSIIGSVISYYIGKYGGKAFIRKYGKYFLLDETDLAKTEKWFHKSGEKTVLISRFVPVVRHFISLPAGMGNMNMKKFVVFTFVGATLWNAFLAYCGYALGTRWEMVKKYVDYVSIPVALLLVVACAIVIYRHVKHKKSSGHW